MVNQARAREVGINLSVRLKVLITFHQYADRTAYPFSHWNRRCQPLIFDTIRLRSRSDVYEFLSLLKREDSRISQYIRTLIVEQTGCTGPWVHLVELELDRILECRRAGLGFKRGWLLELKLDSPFPEELTRGFRVRSINATLPKSPPASLARYGSVELRNIHFHTLGDLMRLVAEMPNLSQLRGHKLVWEDNPRTRPPQRTARALRTVILTDCSNRWAPMWLMTGPTWPRPALGYISQEYMLHARENGVACKICRSIAEGLDIIEWPQAALVLQNRTYYPQVSGEYVTLQFGPPHIDCPGSH